MKHLSEDERTRKALCRFEVIAPLVGKELPRGVQKKLIQEQASRLHVSEHQQLICVSERTIERYLSSYRRGGLEMLKPKMRKEQGSLKAFPADALEQAIEVRSQHPELSADSIIDVLQTKGVSGAEQMRVSTLNRHFRRLSKDRPSLKKGSRKRYRLWTVDGAHQLWICDVWDGPMLPDPVQAKNRRLRLVAILDSHTRYIIQAEFYFNENRPCLEDTLLKAILKHGVPQIFYCDNAKVFRSGHLKRIAGELGFGVRHTKPQQPQGRGKLERWFRTVADKFDPLLRAQIESGAVKTLSDVNRYLAAWVEERYHQRRHGTLKMSPANALAAAKECGAWLARIVEPETVREAFLWREARQVSSLAAIKLYGNQYEVDEGLIGKSVEIRYNPYDLARILVYFEGQCRGEAHPYKMKNFTEKRVRDRAETRDKAMDEVMDKIVGEHAERTREKAGLSFAQAMGVKPDA